MSVTIPEADRDLLERPIYVQLGTHLPNGSIQVHPVWCNLDGNTILINSAKGRIKDRNMRRNPNVTILAMDPDDPFHWVEVRGLVEEITEEGADKHIDELSELYFKKPYPFRFEGEVRVTYKIKPTKVVNFSPG